MTKRLYLFTVMMFITTVILAQSLNVKGTVTDDTKEPIVGAYVRVKGG